MNKLRSINSKFEIRIYNQKFKYLWLVFYPLLLLIPPDPVWGVDWQFYSANEYYFCLYDPGRVLRPDPDVVQVWTNWIATKEGKKYRTQEMARTKVPKSVLERYESTRVRMAIHCADRTYQILSISDYDEQQREIGNGSRGCFLEEFITSQPIRKNSSEEDLYKILCSGQKGK
jgi:hypothetical protein